ncbi:MAG: RNA methyltransferase [Chloroherpetonaceae bacterium]|nr:RNA methyltransferase [Chloroherpetonaceae bacterium]MCS7210986.1 RNA methyltransferase [Chloroherpetonaceae bacterium]MDW8466801.1 RNA methyltransferase [Chloroherpetonaceae bacterium]
MQSLPFLSKAKVKLYARLHDKKIRDAERLFLAEGERTVRQLLQTLPNPDMLVALCFNAAHLPDTATFSPYRPKLFLLSAHDFARLAETQEPQPILGIFRQPCFTMESLQLLSHSCASRLVIALNGVQDAGNVGTIVRTAAWFNVHALLSDTQTADFFSPKVVRASAGSLFAMPLVRSTHFLQDLHALQRLGYTLYATVPSGKALSSLHFSPQSLVIIGSEASGIAPEVLQLADQTISIRGNWRAVESLNAAVAAGIIIARFAEALGLLTASSS